MKKWRDMNAAERKQDKYDRRRVRKEFDVLAAVQPRKRGGYPTFASRQRASMRQQALNRRRGLKYKLVPCNNETRNSPREMGRRKRQIERSQLREANGLVAFA